MGAVLIGGRDLEWWLPLSMFFLVSTCEGRRSRGLGLPGLAISVQFDLRAAV